MGVVEPPRRLTGNYFWAMGSILRYALASRSCNKSWVFGSKLMVQVEPGPGVEVGTQGTLLVEADGKHKGKVADKHFDTVADTATARILLCQILVLYLFLSNSADTPA